MIPHLAENDINMFYKYLNKAKVYFEFGSGGSTYQASIRDNIEKIYCVESDEEWVNKLKKNIKNDKVIYLYTNLNTKPKTWGYPGSKCKDKQKKLYSDRLVNRTKELKDNLDLVFIDGRFRVACCLKCFNIIKPDCLIAFDDFLTRKEYHVVLKYFDIVEKTSDKRMVILKKKENVKSVPKKLIQKYELISR